MKTYYVKRYWEVYDEVKVEAESTSEAVDRAYEQPLGSSPRYVDDSMNIEEEVDVQEEL